MSVYSATAQPEDITGKQGNLFIVNLNQGFCKVKIYRVAEKQPTHPVTILLFITGRILY